MRKMAVLNIVAAFLVSATAAQADTLDQVKKRGYLTCGANPRLAGFGIPDDHGHWNGFDIDFCRAVAAAVFYDAGKVKFIPLSGKNRFTALENGEIDVLSHNTTWTLSRETGQGFLFAGINYFDGQGFMARKKFNYSSALELSGASVCVEQGTTTELNLADFFRANNMKYEAVAFPSAEEALRAYDNGRCGVFTTDASGLYAERSRLADPEDSVVLPEIISKEPLGPVVRQGDDRWFNLVKWVNFALIDAEELGVTSKNVDEMAKSESPDIKRLLGFEGNFGAAMGLELDWAYRVVKLVGNYGEMFDRNLGEGSKLKIKRGLNALWTKGGLLYSPPIR